MDCGGWAGWLQIDCWTDVACGFGEVQNEGGTGSGHRARRWVSREEFIKKQYMEMLSILLPI